MGRTYPFYTDVDGFRIPGPFSPTHFQSALKYQPKDEDLFIVTFPKCGTTWTEQIVILLLRKGETEFKDTKDQYTISPYLDMYGSKYIEEECSRPFCIKTHLPFDLCPKSKRAKYLVVCRNPRDTCVSFYHHTRGMVYDFQNGSFDDFFEVFINGENDYGDYFDHTISWYKRRRDSNVLLMTYEEMKEDHRGAIVKIAGFMGEEYAELVRNEEMLEKIVKCSSFEYMKKEMSGNGEESSGRNGEESHVGRNSEESSVRNGEQSHTRSNEESNVRNQENSEDSHARNSEESQENSYDFYADMPDGMKEMMENYEKRMSGREEEPSSGGNAEEYQLVRKGILGDWKNHFSEDQLRRLDERLMEKTTQGQDIKELMDVWKKCGVM